MYQYIYKYKYIAAFKFIFHSSFFFFWYFFLTAIITKLLSKTIVYVCIYASCVHINIYTIFFFFLNENRYFKDISKVDCTYSANEKKPKTRNRKGSFTTKYNINGWMVFNRSFCWNDRASTRYKFETEIITKNKEITLAMFHRFLWFFFCVSCIWLSG